MKFLKTVGINLLQFARSRTLVCVLILLGLTIAGFCLNVYYAQAMADITSLKASHHADRDLKFVFTQDVSSKQVLAGLQKGSGRFIADFWDLRLFDEYGYYLSSKSVDDTRQAGKADGYGLVGVLMDNRGNLILTGRDLQPQDKDADNAVADFTVVFSDEEKRTVQIGENSFQIVGQAKLFESSKCLQIDYRRMAEKDIPIRAAVLTFENIPTAQEVETVRQAFLRLDPKAKVILPEPAKGDYGEYFFAVMKLPLIMTAFALLSIAALIGFAFTINRRKYNIYKLCGISKAGLRLLCAADVAAFTLTGYLLGSLLSTVFIAATGWTEYQMGFLDFGAVYLAILLATLLLTCLPLLRVARHFEKVEV